MSDTPEMVRKAAAYHMTRNKETAALADRVTANMLTRYAELLDQHEALKDQLNTLDDLQNHGISVMRVSVDNDGNIRAERVAPVDIHKEPSDEPH